MFPITNKFRSELDKQIRNVGHCDIWFYFTVGGAYHVPEAYIKSVEMRNTGDPLGRSLPVEECVISLLDYEKIWYPIGENSLLDQFADGAQTNVQFGIETDDDIEWMYAGSYFLKERPKWNNYIATFTFVSDLTRLTDLAPGISDNVDTLMDLAEETAMGNGATGYNPYNITVDFASNLDSIPVLHNASIEGKTVADTLLSIAVASQNCLKTDSQTGDITIRDYFGFDTELNPSVVRQMDMLELPNLERLPLVQKIIATYYEEPDVPPERETVLNLTGDFTIDTGDEPQYIGLTKAIAGGTLRVDERTNITQIQYLAYRDHILITRLIRPDPTADFTLVCSGVQIQPTEKKISYIPWVKGTEDEEVSNPLFSFANCVRFFPIPSYRHGYLADTRDMYTIQYRGDPSIDALDIIRVELDGYGIVPCIVVDRTFRFEHGFSGTLSVRRIDNPTSTQISTTAVSSLAVSDYAVSDEE